MVAKNVRSFHSGATVPSRASTAAAWLEAGTPGMILLVLRLQGEQLGIVSPDNPLVLFRKLFGCRLALYREDGA